MEYVRATRIADCCRCFETRYLFRVSSFFALIIRSSVIFFYLFSDFFFLVLMKQALFRGWMTSLFLFVLFCPTQPPPGGEAERRSATAVDEAERGGGTPSLLIAWGFLRWRFCHVTSPVLRVLPKREGDGPAWQWLQLHSNPMPAIA